MKSTSLAALVVGLLSQQVIAGGFGGSYYSFGNGFGGGIRQRIRQWFGRWIWKWKWRPFGVGQPGTGLWGPHRVSSPATWFTSGNIGGQSPSGGLYRLPVLGGNGGLSGFGASDYDSTYDDSSSFGTSSPSSWSRPSGGSRFGRSGSYGSLVGASGRRSASGGSSSQFGDADDTFYVSSRRPRGSGRSASFSSFPVTENKNSSTFYPESVLGRSAREEGKIMSQKDSSNAVYVLHQPAL
ncbi:hypothetical protein MTO96_023881 [Rhipicephalus appendiculatus]